MSAIVCGCVCVCVPVGEKKKLEFSFCRAKSVLRTRPIGRKLYQNVIELLLSAEHHGAADWWATCRSCQVLLPGEVCSSCPSFFEKNVAWSEAQQPPVCVPRIIRERGLNFPKQSVRDRIEDLSTILATIIEKEGGTTKYRNKIPECQIFGFRISSIFFLRKKSGIPTRNPQQTHTWSIVVHKESSDLKGILQNSCLFEVIQFFHF